MRSMGFIQSMSIAPTSGMDMDSMDPLDRIG